MKLLYLDESASTGTDLENKQQPFFVLAGVYVEDKKMCKERFFENLLGS